MRLPLSRHLPGPVLLVSMAACGGGAPGVSSLAPAGPAPAEHAGYVVTMGRDTLSVERFTLTADSLSGEVVSRSPTTTRRQYAVVYAPGGGLRRVQVTTTPLAAGPTQLPVTVTLDVRGDSADEVTVRGDSTARRRVPVAARALPMVIGAFAPFEQALRRMRAASQPAVEHTILVPGLDVAYPMELALAGDSGTIGNVAGYARIRSDAAGRLLALDGSETTQKVQLVRQPTVDVAALGARFVQQEVAGRGLGALSPRDTVRARIGAAEIVIDYGRPAARGRRILGGVVPLDTVWRTGANAATGLRTTRELRIGNATVPAGAYTLFTLPTRTGWTLIVNRQTGQWGTDHDPAQDLVRVPLATGTPAAPVELFTITLEPTGDGAGLLRLAWGDAEASVPVVAR